MPRQGVSGSLPVLWEFLRLPYSPDKLILELLLQGDFGSVLPPLGVLEAALLSPDELLRVLAARESLASVPSP